MINDREECKVLGLRWDRRNDVFKFSVKFNFSVRVNDGINKPYLLCKLSSEKPLLLNKRIILSQINDPSGLLGPVIVRAKILLKQL